MSRIDEALRHAGLTSQPASDPSADAVDSFVAQENADPQGAQPLQTPGPEEERQPAAEDRPPMRVFEHGAERGPYAGATEKLVVHQNVGPLTVEQFRRLGAVLHNVHDTGIKVIMIASARVGEGKTLTAANLALTLGESYKKRVLLIDADLRRPSLLGLLGMPNVPGLSEGLKSKTGSPFPVVDLSEYVALLPGGAPDPDPMSGLTSDRMRQIIQEAREGFDWVIIDTPPITLLPDAHLLARLADASLLVIGAGTTPYALVQKAVEALGRDRIVGVVLNRIAGGSEKEADYYAYRYGYGYARPQKGTRARLPAAARTPAQT
jgi:protein-tyrosine kinase